MAGRYLLVLPDSYRRRAEYRASLELSDIRDFLLPWTGGLLDVRRGDYYFSIPKSRCLPVDGARSRS